MHPVSLMGTGTVYTVPFFICAEGLIPSSVGGGGLRVEGAISRCFFAFQLLILPPRTAFLSKSLKDRNLLVPPASAPSRSFQLTGDAVFVQKTNAHGKNAPMGLVFDGKKRVFQAEDFAC